MRRALKTTGWLLVLLAVTLGVVADLDSLSESVSKRIDGLSDVAFLFAVGLLAYSAGLRRGLAARRHKRDGKTAQLAEPTAKRLPEGRYEPVPSVTERETEALPGRGAKGSGGSQVVG